MLRRLPGLRALSPILLVALTATAAAQGGALRFDGIDDLTVVPNTMGDFDFGDAVTLEAWVQADTATPAQPFVSGKVGAAGLACGLGGGIGTPSAAGMIISTPGTNSAFGPAGTLPTAGWVHLAGTYDGGMITMYIDGVQVGQSSHSGNVSFVSELIFGERAGAGNVFFEGVLDEVRVWDVVRTPAEIQATFMTQLAGNEPGLVGYYKFDEGGGDVILDSSTRGNDGMLGATVGAGADDPTRVASDAPVGPGAIGMNYCSALPNSTGGAASISADGSRTASDNDLTLSAAGMPAQQFGIFLTSRTQALTPVASGNLCLGGNIIRFQGPGQILQSSAAGEFSLSIDLTAIPAGVPTPVGAGETWNYQAWFRDVDPTMGQTANFTDGFQIDFD